MSSSAQPNGSGPLPRRTSWLLVLAAGAVIAGSIIALTGCVDGQGVTPAQAQSMVTQFAEETAAAMEAAGVDPAEATEEQWKEFGSPVASKILGAMGGSAPPEPAQDWWEVLLGLAGTYFGIKGSVLGVQTVGAILAGKQNRATANLQAIVQPTDPMTTLKAIAALALDTHTPAPPAPGAASSPPTP